MGEVPPNHLWDRPIFSIRSWEEDAPEPPVATQPLLQMMKEEYEYGARVDSNVIAPEFSLTILTRLNYQI